MIQRYGLFSFSAWETVATRPAAMVLESLSWNLKFSNRRPSFVNAGSDSRMGWKLILGLYMLWGFHNQGFRSAWMWRCFAVDKCSRYHSSLTFSPSSERNTFTRKFGYHLPRPHHHTQYRKFQVCLLQLSLLHFVKTNTPEGCLWLNSFGFHSESVIGCDMYSGLFWLIVLQCKCITCRLIQYVIKYTFLSSLRPIGQAVLLHLVSWRDRRSIINQQL
jgi:hypothetical protein